LGYAWAVIKGYFSSTEQQVEIELQNEKISNRSFFITIANGSQWGYNAKVAPDAKLDDGIFHIVLCKKPPFLSLIPFGIKILSGKILTSAFVTVKTSNEITMSSQKGFFYHLDGDAKGVSCKIEIALLPKTLNIVTK